MSLTAVQHIGTAPGETEIVLTYEAKGNAKVTRDAKVVNVFLVDVSGSMNSQLPCSRQTRIESVCDAIVTMTNNKIALTDDEDLSSHVLPWGEEALPPFELSAVYSKTHRHDVAASLLNAKFRPRGGTSLSAVVTSLGVHLPAVLQSLESKGNILLRVVLLTDADALDGDGFVMDNVVREVMHEFYAMSPLAIKSFSFECYGVGIGLTAATEQRFSKMIADPAKMINELDPKLAIDKLFGHAYVPCLFEVIGSAVGISVSSSGVAFSASIKNSLQLDLSADAKILLISSSTKADPMACPEEFKLRVRIGEADFLVDVPAVTEIADATIRDARLMRFMDAMATNVVPDLAEELLSQKFVTSERFGEAILKMKEDVIRLINRRLDCLGFSPSVAAHGVMQQKLNAAWAAIDARIAEKRSEDAKVETADQARVSLEEARIQVTKAELALTTIKNTQGDTQVVETKVSMARYRKRKADVDPIKNAENFLQAAVNKVCT